MANSTASRTASPALSSGTARGPTLIGRKKDMIISGGMNIYPVDLEGALLVHPAVQEAAVVGAKSREWGETPVGFVTLRPGASADKEQLRGFANARLGRMQRLSDVRIVTALPRSAIGKVLKRELQDRLSLEATHQSGEGHG